MYAERKDEVSDGVAIAIMDEEHKNLNQFIRFGFLCFFFLCVSTGVSIILVRGNAARAWSFVPTTCLASLFLALVTTGLASHARKIGGKIRIPYVVRFIAAMTITAVAAYASWLVLTSLRLNATPTGPLSVIDLLKIGGMNSLVAIVSVYFTALPFVLAHWLIQQVCSALKLPLPPRWIPIWIIMFALSCAAGIVMVWINYLVIEPFTWWVLLGAAAFSLILSVLAAGMGMEGQSNDAVYAHIAGAPIGCIICGIYLSSGAHFLPFHDQIEHVLMIVASNSETILAWSAVIYGVMMVDKLLLERNQKSTAQPTPLASS